MTSISDLNLQANQTLNDADARLLDQIAPHVGHGSSTLNPMIASLIIALLAWGITSHYFTKFFNNVKYLPFVQSGLIFSAVLITILFLT